MVWLLVLVMGLGIYFRTKYDRKYVLPILKSDRKLSQLVTFCVVSVVVALILSFTNYRKFSYFMLMVTAPIAIYLNIKIYGQAWRNSKREKND